jgi:hypothetical protein
MVAREGHDGTYKTARPRRQPRDAAFAPLALSGELLEELQDLTRLGVPAERFLGEDLMPVDLDLEPAARGLDQLDVGLRIVLANLSRQTGGSRLVVSNDAVFNRDAHDEYDSRA